jgi:hypothetical protein
MKRIALVIIIMVSLLNVAVAQSGPYNIELKWDRFHDYDEVIAIQKQLNKAYPEITKLEQIGASYEGRPMYVLTISNPKTGDEFGKPGMWVDGNIHGNEIQGSETALYLCWYVLENYGKNERITNIVDRVNFYVLPTLNPDGRARYIAGNGSSRSGNKPLDSDNDGLFDEDDSEDLNGDGFITRMRKKVEYGDMKLNLEDPRLMERVTDEKGEYIQLGSEGIDNDGDGQINEDGPGGYDPNRNWGYNWQPPYIQRGANDYPFNLPESQAVRDFFLSHTNILGLQTYHNTGGMILRGPGVKNYGDYPRSDLAAYDKIGKIGEKMLPYYRYIILWKDLYPVWGGSMTWGIGGFGAFAFSNELDYSAIRDLDGDGEVDQAERMEFNDILEFGNDYVAWEEFDHPTYGKIEIGGYTRYASRLAPLWRMPETVHRNAAFGIFHAECLPEVSIKDVKVEKLDGDLFQITALIINERPIPTAAAFAIKNNIGRRDFALITGKGMEVVAKGIVNDLRNDHAALDTTNPAQVKLEAIPGDGAVRVRWIVKGKGTGTVTFTSEKAGIRTADFSTK